MTFGVMNSGSGKSTMEKVVTGLYQEWAGKILFDGIDRKKIPRALSINLSIFVLEEATSALPP